jgi:outer membrane protein OmpA-like peptidoglycan-associated protein
MAADAATAAPPPAPVGPADVFRVSPATVPGAFNTLRTPLAPRATWLLDDIRFALDSSFIYPEAAEDFALIAALRHDHPGAPLALFAHADRSGEEDYNKKLSGRRAVAVYAVLTRKVELWEQLYSTPFGNDRWGDAELDAMIAAVEGAEPTTAGAGSPSSAQRKAARAMLFRDYMDVLCRDLGGTPFTLDETSDFLGAGIDSRGKADYQGCGELNPVVILASSELRALSGPDSKVALAEAHAPNRRVTGVFFAPGSRVDPAKWPCPRALDGNAGCHKRMWSDGQTRLQPGATRRTHEVDGDTFSCRFYDRLAREPITRRATLDHLRIRLVDSEGKPKAGEPYVFVVAGARASGTSDRNGFVDLRVPSTTGAGTLEMQGQSVRIEIEPLPVVTSVSGVQVRLRNLGFYFGPVDGVTSEVTREAIRSFQHEMGRRGIPLVANGNPNDRATQQALFDAHGS